MNMDTVTLKLLIFLTFTITYIHHATPVCPATVHADIRGFGPNCTYRCNCNNNEQCDNVTGECPQPGCLHGWMGPGCQYRNFATAAAATTQESIQSNSAEHAMKAIDGNISTCSKTNPPSGQTEPWWQAELMTEIYIVGLVIKIQASVTGNFRGFLIEASNTTDNFRLCYKHTNDTDGEAVMDVSCKEPVVAKYWRIKLTETDVDLELCEVEIYGGRLVSFNRPTTMETTLNYSGFWNSSYAVDGRKMLPGENADNEIGRTCSATEQNSPSNEKENWWRVDLEITYLIQAISFFSRLQKSGQYESFEVIVINASGQLNKTVFTDTFSNNVNDYQPKSGNFTTPFAGNIVRVERNNKQILVLCEFEVFAECPHGTCGWQCNETCMCISQTTGRHKIDGTCPYGCSGRWAGLNGKCTNECSDTQWGPYCNSTCGKCSNNSACDASNGICPGLCEPGWTSPTCGEACSDGSYGEGCNDKCGNCLTDASCSHLNGTCLDGCAAGYKGIMCTTICNEGSYGNDCSETCGHCLDDAICDHEDGACLVGCAAGYQGTVCKTTCSDGSYGEGCNDKCGNCLTDASCSHLNGTCLDGCAAGYKGIMCTTICNEGSYGNDCSETCGHCLDDAICDHEDGACLVGCAAGYQGTVCKTTCSDGSYGEGCNDTCGNCRTGASCYHLNGTCLDGCAAGYKGIMCTTICNNGSFGEGCVRSCGNCAMEKPCNHATGACPLGCTPGYAGNLCNDIEDPQRPPIAIIAAAVGLVVVIAVVVTVCIIFKRRSNKNIRKRDENGSQVFTMQGVLNETNTNVVIHTSAVESSEEVVANTNTGDNALIDIPQLRNVYAEAKHDPTFLISEFQDLPYGLKFDASEAKDVQYKTRNRYRDMYPYNSNRVHLPEIPGESGSTYINASYINGYDMPRKYIAAQGAIEKTVDDIWRMVWAEQVSVIVMLTKCYELGRLKCFQYWSDEGAHVYGNICTEVVSTEEYSDFNVKTIQLTQIDSAERRTVIQFKYTAWPDKDVPATALSIVQFWRTVRKNENAKQFPWLVHCSAGVGRTGTFIALDYLYEQGLSEGAVNIKAGVNTLRKQRLNMVQTEEQYIYLHEAVAEVLDPIGCVCQNEEFGDVYQRMFTDSGTPTQALHFEFQNICRTTEAVSEIVEYDTYMYQNTSNKQYANAKLIENLRRSRNAEISPADRHRPRLGMVVEGRDDFINAVFVPTFRQMDRLILTQYPLEDTVVDFLRMIWEYNISIIVLLEEHVTQDGCYWPSNTSSKEIGPFIAELMFEKSEDVYLARTIRYSFSGSAEQKEVRQFHFKSWPQAKNTPVNTGSILRLISDIELVNKNTDNSPMVIQCNDGGKKSGLFCILCCVLEMMKSDREVAIAETVRLVRLRRRQVIDNFEQYQFCYNIVQEYLESYNVYANVL